MGARRWHDLVVGVAVPNAPKPPPYHPTERRPGAAPNPDCQKADGDWAAFSDADDFVARDYFEAVAAILERWASKGNARVCTQLWEQAAILLCCPMRMKKRVSIAYVASLLLPCVAFAILMLRSFGSGSRWAALIVYLLGWIGLSFALRNHQRARRKLSLGKLSFKQWWSESWRYAITAAGVVAVGTAMLVLVPIDAAPFVGVQPAMLTEQIAEDRAVLLRSRQGLEDSLTALEPRLASSASTDAIQKHALQAAWARYLDYAIQLDRIVQTHKYFYQINAATHPTLNSQSFLIGYFALVSQLRFGFRLSNAVGVHEHLDQWLDQQSDSLGLPKDTYFQFRQGLTRADNLLRLEAGMAYVKLLRRVNTFAQTDLQLLEASQTDAKAVVLSLGRDPEVLVDTPLDRFEKQSFKAWFPLQKSVAIAMSDIRTARRSNFMAEGDIVSLRSALEPSDILLERRNWYLTNIGLPGFWPHAALYTGTLKELDAYFGPEARQATRGMAPSEYLKRHFPSAHAQLSTPDANGNHRSVIEAVGEGVVLTSLEHSADADYVAALRPRLGRNDKLASLLRAFGYFGKPYDFNFDFITDDAVVCSELVFKALQPAVGKRGLDFALQETSGRLVLSPNQIARVFDEQADAAERNMDFVAYYEGSEAERKAVARGESEFRNSWRKPKWDIAQR